MNRNRIIQATTAVALISMMLLLYWVFAFGCVTIFGLKVFRENITQAFGLSILGILALLAGSLIVNMILNLSKIADSLASGAKGEALLTDGFPTGRQIIIGALAFPAIALGLFLGDRSTTKNRERFLTESARAVLREYPKQLDSLTTYTFSKEYVTKAGEVLAVLARSNESAPNVMVIVPDQIGDQSVILGFGPYNRWESSKEERKKTEFIYSCSKDELLYLKAVFAGSEKTHRFSASDGNYELYFPVESGGRSIVVYFSDRREYGKFGS